MAAPDRDSQIEPRPAVSTSAVVISDEAVSASRSIQLADVPSRWLDRMLVAFAELPVDAGEAAVISTALDALRSILAGHGVVLRQIHEAGAPTYRSVAHGEESRLEGATPERQLPGYAYERMIRIPEAPGMVLHIATDDAALEDERSPATQLGQRMTFALRTALAHARMHEDLRARSAELVQAEKLASLGQLAAGLVHELNNPLTSIVAYTDFLLKRAASRADSADDVERLRRISESAGRMLRFTRDIVSYARPSGDTSQPVVISAVIDQAVGFCEHLLEEHGVEVERTFGHGVLPVKGLPAQLAQVFVNLITNACHAMADVKGGRLTIVTELEDGDQAVRVVLTDNGHGIPSDVIDRIFLPFVTTKPEGTGTGLGLAIVKTIVDTHDGSIAVLSDPPRGTSFVLTFPVAKA